MEVTMKTNMECQKAKSDTSNELLWLQETDTYNCTSNRKIFYRQCPVPLQESERNCKYNI